MIGALLSQLGGLANELISRILGLPELVASLLGSRRSKAIRLRVVILRDEQGVPVLDGEAAATAAVEMAKAIFERECGVTVEPADDGPMITVAPTPAPTAALNVHCNLGAWTDDLGPGGAYFRGLTARRSGGVPLGRGTPVTAFVVRSVKDRGGCSIGPLTSYVTVVAAAMRGSNPRTLAHELGHACSLLHRGTEGNLMRPQNTGESLTRWQVAVIRSSSHAAAV